MQEKRLNAIITTVEVDESEHECNCGNTPSVLYECPSIKQEIATLEELVKDPWFIKELENLGFYSKNDVSKEFSHLDKFVYEYGKSPFKTITDTFKYFNCHSDSAENIKVYQEVIGPERVKEVAKVKKLYEGYRNKEKEKQAKAAVIKEKNKEQSRLRKLQNAKKIIEELS